jgi:hypothetical protein
VPVDYTSDTSVKIYSFIDSDLVNKQLVLNYSDLGVNQDVDIVIEDNLGNVVEDTNFVTWSWINSYLTIAFDSNNTPIIDGTWRFKYLINDSIRSNLTS